MTVLVTERASALSWRRDDMTGSLSVKGAAAALLLALLSAACGSANAPAARSDAVTLPTVTPVLSTITAEPARPTPSVRIPSPALAAPKPSDLIVEPTPTSLASELPNFSPEVARGWPATNYNPSGVYSWDGTRCAGMFCSGGLTGRWMHNGYGSGDVAISLVLSQGTTSDDGATPATVA